jgi:hypothetical protein
MTSDAFLTSSSAPLVIPKLYDDGSNWADYELRAKRAMGSKGLLVHLEGCVNPPTPFGIINGIAMFVVNIPVTEDQIEAKEKKIQDFEQKEYLAQYFILSLTSPHLSQKLLNLATAGGMWDAVKHNATTKSSLHLVNILNQLRMMKCALSADPKTHLAEVKAHFKRMTEHHEFLHVTKAPVTNSIYTTIIISSMPNTYHPTIQTVETTMKVTGKKSLAQMT